jgi:hypothetical protein
MASTELAQILEYSKNFLRQLLSRSRKKKKMYCMFLIAGMSVVIYWLYQGRCKQIQSWKNCCCLNVSRRTDRRRSAELQLVWELGCRQIKRQRAPMTSVYMCGSKRPGRLLGASSNLTNFIRLRTDVTVLLLLLLLYIYLHSWFIFCNVCLKCCFKIPW